MRFQGIVGRLTGRLLSALVLALMPAAAWAAACVPAVASLSPAAPKLTLASFRNAAATGEGRVGLTFVGHATFVIESPGGVTIVTDYNDYFRAPVVPDVITMNHAHSTHYTDRIESGVKLVLRGWQKGGGVPDREVAYGDVKIGNVPTNIRQGFGYGFGYGDGLGGGGGGSGGGGGTEFAGNSIFTFEIAELCIAHLSHLHHTLTPEHLAALGQVDVLLAPIDGTYTLSHEDMLGVIDQIKPTLIIPMHYFGEYVLQRFLAKAGDRYPVRTSATPHVFLSRAELPRRPEILVLPGN